MSTLYVKDPNATLDYTWDWSQYLQEGETISSSSIIVPSGLTLSSSSSTTTKAVAWLAGGTLNEVYKVVNRITTSLGRTDDRMIKVRIQER